jgi:hypothetical protein
MKTCWMMNQSRKRGIPVERTKKVGGMSPKARTNRINQQEVNSGR